MEHTPGEWRQGTTPTTVVSDSGDGLTIPGSYGEDNVRIYGGNLIAESVSPNNVPIIAAAPKMKRALERLKAEKEELGSALLAAFLVLTSQKTDLQEWADAISMARHALWRVGVFERKEIPDENN